MEPYDFFRDIYRMYHVNPTKHERRLLNDFLSLRGFSFDFIYVQPEKQASITHYSLESHHLLDSFVRTHRINMSPSQIYCALDPKQCGDRALILHHIIPLSYGGTNKANNLVLVNQNLKTKIDDFNTQRPYLSRRLIPRFKGKVWEPK